MPHILFLKLIVCYDEQGLLHKKEAKIPELGPLKILLQQAEVQERVLPTRQPLDN